MYDMLQIGDQSMFENPYAEQHMYNSSKPSNNKDDGISGLVETLNNDDDDNIKGLFIYEFEDDTGVNDMAFNIWTLSYRHLINYRVEFCWNISIVEGLPV